jgi:hypothetical protein
MEEVFPVLAGIAVGLVTHRASPLWLRAVIVAVLGVAFGALASWVSGELAVSWAYILVDTAQVVVVAVMTAVLVSVWQRRRARRLAR